MQSPGKSYSTIRRETHGSVPSQIIPPNRGKPSVSVLFKYVPHEVKVQDPASQRKYCAFSACRPPERPKSTFEWSEKESRSILPHSGCVPCYVKEYSFLDIQMSLALWFDPLNQRYLVICGTRSVFVPQEAAKVCPTCSTALPSLGGFAALTQLSIDDSAGDAAQPIKVVLYRTTYFDSNTCLYPKKFGLHKMILALGMTAMSYAYQSDVSEISWYLRFHPDSVLRENPLRTEYDLSLFKMFGFEAFDPTDVVGLKVLLTHPSLYERRGRVFEPQITKMVILELFPRPWGLRVLFEGVVPTSNKAWKPMVAQGTGGSFSQMFHRDNPFYEEITEDRSLEDMSSDESFDSDDEWYEACM